jgi:ABC-type transport system substrate-binding protein
MGWCNQAASDAIVKANNTLVREDRIAAYDIVQEEFAKDMVSLPLFQRTEGEAWSLNVEGIKVDPTYYGTASAEQWSRTDGGDTIIVGFSQEPASLHILVESAAVAVQASHLAKGVYTTQYNYDFQPVLQTELSTVEAGLATNEDVEVKAGDMVYNTSGEPVELAAGVKVFNAAGEEVEWDGSAALTMKQLTVNYKLKDYTWSDGTAGSVADIELGVTHECDPESGATEFITCNAILEKTFGPGLEYTLKYVPGYQSPTYFVLPFGIYPAHQVLSDGRNLKDVPAAEWTTLPEIAEQPLSFGPFVLTEWRKGESMTFEVNPHYQPAPKVAKIVIVIVADTNQAVAQLLAGDIDYLEKATLGAGPEVETVLKAAEEGQINAEFIANPTWEHADFNLYVR